MSMPVVGPAGSREVPPPQPPGQIESLTNLDEIRAMQGHRERNSDIKTNLRSAIRTLTTS
jgi:hypothetical protein